MQRFSFLFIMLAAASSSTKAWVSRSLPRRVASLSTAGLRTISTTKLASTAADSSTTTAVTVNNRLSRQDLSLEIRSIASHLPVVLSHLTARRASEESKQAAQTIADLSESRIALIQERDNFLNQRKEASAVVGKLMQSKDDLDDAQQAELEQAKEISSKAAEGAAKAEAELDEIQSTMDGLLAGIPNLIDDIVPDGKDEASNEEVYKWGDVQALPVKLGWDDSFKPAWHDDVATGLKGYQAEAAVKMSGARFVALSGGVAQMERAISMFMIDLHTEKHGYTEMSVPYVVSRSTLEGTGQLPKFEDDLFAITPASHTCNGEDAFLIPTAEVPLTSMHRDQVMEEADLPISYVAWTPCFRAEAGSYGRDTKGLIRTHQFQKVELVKITSAETSSDEHEALTKHAEAVLQALELPYRKVRLCSGDIGFSARHCYDLEVWLPGAAEYREISSCSNTGDFQARRMGLRYRPKAEPAADGKKQKKPKPQLCHTINGSGLAVGRTLVAVLENYQRADGSVVVPGVLRPYMGGKEVLEAPGGK
jgi:seryl-tRNA synthetase